VLQHHLGKGGFHEFLVDERAEVLGSDITWDILGYLSYWF
jgi:hypothetical protein